MLAACSGGDLSQIPVSGRCPEWWRSAGNDSADLGLAFPWREPRRSGFDGRQGALGSPWRSNGPMPSRRDSV